VPDAHRMEIEPHSMLWKEDNNAAFLLGASPNAVLGAGWVGDGVLLLTRAERHRAQAISMVYHAGHGEGEELEIDRSGPHEDEDRSPPLVHSGMRPGMYRENSSVFSMRLYSSHPPSTN